MIGVGKGVMREDEVGGVIDERGNLRFRSSLFEGFYLEEERGRMFFLERLYRL